MYNFVWPMGNHMMSDIFLFVLRNIYVVFLVAVTVFVILLWLEIEPYIPKQEKKTKPKVRRSVKKNATGTAHADTSPATNGHQHDTDTESGT
ncbi:unnamed protein product [Allacma fusca]|uniref:Uncharacterized protein n=1 Tax=Allacma fusca TaxID=39272 RepID=A0A8J2KYB6_9HEXA|nr:unnamed protein product [Allacma fusca]